MNQIQISILYELIEFVYNVHLHEIVKLRKTEKMSANLPHLRGKLAADDSPLLKISRSNFENLQLNISWKICMPTCPTKFLPTNPTGCFSNK